MLPLPLVPILSLFISAPFSEAFNVRYQSSTMDSLRTLPLSAYKMSTQDIVVDRTRRSIYGASIFSAFTITSLVLAPETALARLEPVNRPDLLPKEPNLNVIQTEKFLTSGQVKRMNDMLFSLERDTGFRLRVLCQSYPNTPGLAIRDYWSLGKEVGSSLFNLEISLALILAHSLLYFFERDKKMTSILS